MEISMQKVQASGTFKEEQQQALADHEFMNQQLQAENERLLKAGWDGHKKIFGCEVCDRIAVMELYDLKEVQTSAGSIAHELVQPAHKFCSVHMRTARILCLDGIDRDHREYANVCKARQEPVAEPIEVDAAAHTVQGRVEDMTDQLEVRKAREARVLDRISSPNVRMSDKSCETWKFNIHDVIADAQVLEMLAGKPDNAAAISQAAADNDYTLRLLRRDPNLVEFFAIKSNEQPPSAADQKDKKCPGCGGSGRIVNPAYVPGVGCEPYWLTCPTCGGSGNVPDQPSHPVTVHSDQTAELFSVSMKINEQPPPAMHLEDAQGNILFRISQDGKVFLSDKIDLADLQNMPRGYLYALREMVNTAIYDAEHTGRSLT
jgi:hypothetical protein